MKTRLYRGIRIDTGDWVYGSLVVQGRIHFIIPECPYDYTGEEDNDLTFYKWYEVKPETVGQCTGQRDNSGKSIYEGDIVKIAQLKGYSIVVWDNEQSLFRMKKQDSNSGLAFGIYSYPIKTVGTIHTHPELIP